MTKKLSTKRIRLLVLLSVILTSISFLVTSQHYSSKIESVKTEKPDATEEFISWRKKYGSKNPEKQAAKGKTSGTSSSGSDNASGPKDTKTSSKSAAKPAGKPQSKEPDISDKEYDFDSEMGDIDGENSSKPPSKPHNTKLNPPANLGLGDQTTSPKMKPNNVPEPVYSEETPDPNNPNGFLGGIEQLEQEELEINGSIYEEDSDEQAMAEMKNNKIGDIEHEDSFGGNPKKTQGYGRLGVPSPDKFGKALSKTVTTEAKPYAEINDNFYKLTIKPLKFRIYSHNVKNGGHDILVPGEEVWNDRYRKITNSIKFSAQANTIVTLQEVYKFQMLDIMEELNKFSPENEPEWEYYARGRIDGEDIGEFVPILYKPSEWELVFEDTIWLNDKNERMSLEGWDAKYLRILSYVTLKHKQTGNYVNVFNTHLDHIGELSRIGAAEVIVQKMEEINKWPSFLCGDLNNEAKGEAYQILTDKLVDSAKHSTPFNRFGHLKSTVTGFEGEVLTSGGQNIDYIFAPAYTKKITFKVGSSCEGIDKYSKEPGDKLLLRLEQFGLLHSKYNGVYMSDHRPLVADFSLNGKC